MINCEELKAVTVYRLNSVAWFRSSEEQFWQLHNTAGKMEIYWPLIQEPANRWRSSEHLYHASKYSADVQCMPKDSKPGDTPFVRERIRNHSSPLYAKATQKCAVAAGLVRKDWETEEVRIKAMLWVLELKLFWNPFTFGKTLATTGDLPIVELLRPGREKDSFWGAVDKGDGTCVGQNVFGKLLVDVRSRMDAVKRGQFTFPDGFLLP
jgi:predicted NAD-dependent protein-ADP-ribosyltransferase YbiA (DUF1768 family)